MFAKLAIVPGGGGGKIHQNPFHLFCSNNYGLSTMNPIYINYKQT